MGDVAGMAISDSPAIHRSGTRMPIASVKRRHYTVASPHCRAEQSGTAGSVRSQRFQRSTHPLITLFQALPEGRGESR